MATPLVANDLLSVVIACRVASHAQIGLSSPIYRVFNAAALNLEDVPRLLYQRFEGPYRTWLPTEAIFQGVSVTRLATLLRPAAGPFYYVQNGGGTNGAGVLPLQTSGLIRKTTPGDDAHVPPIKAGKGRLYIPFPAIASWNGTEGTLNLLGFQKLETIRSVVGTDITLPGGARLRLSMKRTKAAADPLAPPELLGYTDVTALTSLRAAATQRRRGDFGRINAAFGGIL